MQYVTLLGAEQVEKAGHQINSAASSLSSTVGQLDEVLYHHYQRMEELVVRFEEALKQRNLP